MQNYTITLTGEYEDSQGYTYYKDLVEFSIKAVDYDAAELMGEALAGSIPLNDYRCISWSVRDE